MIRRWLAWRAYRREINRILDAGYRMSPATETRIAKEIRARIGD